MSYPPSELSHLTERELLILTCERVQELHGKMADQDRRLTDVERDRDEVRGAMRVMKALWALAGLLAGLFGWHAAKH